MQFSLPPEIWDLVINLLQHDDQRSCLLLSRLHHDIVFPKLFSRVTATLGLRVWRPWTPIDSEEPISVSNDDHSDSRMIRVNNTTREILSAISCCPDFARAVRDFIVRAYVWGDGKDTYDERSLIGALEKLTNLHAFRWYGERPAPSSATLNALAKVSSTTLIELQIPMLESMAFILHQVNFPSLQSLALVFPEASAEVVLDGPDSDAVNRLLDATAPTLTRLSISGDSVWRREFFGSFIALQELELIHTTTFNGLHNILTHCTALTSLTLLPASSLNELFAALDAQPSALPGLTAFKFLNHMQLDVDVDLHVEALCTFLKNKTRLKRLDVLLDGPERAEVPLLEVLPTLPALEILGIDFVRYEWHTEDVEAFERVIPPRLSALRLHPVTDHLRAPYREAWLKLFKSRTSLRYLHIIESIMMIDLENPEELEDSPFGLRFHPLSAEELPGSLELFGYGLYLRPIVRDPESRSGVDKATTTRSEFGPCWPLEKVMFRTARDFGCADWEWLLRWQDFGGLGSLRPGMLKGGV